MKKNDITGLLIDIFIKTHSKLGPGLLESVYEEIVCHELKKRKINYSRNMGFLLYTMRSKWIWDSEPILSLKIK